MAAPPRPARAPAPSASATGARALFSKCVSRMASWAVPGSSTTALRGLGSGIADAGAIRMSTSPLGPSSNSSMWVWVWVPVRPPTWPLPEGRAERHAEVGAVTPVPEQPVGPRVVEHAEQVVHVGVVDQELAVLVLEREELGVQRVGASRRSSPAPGGRAGSPTGSPRPGRRRTRGHPVAWRTTSSAAVCACSQASNAAFSRSSCIRVTLPMFARSRPFRRAPGNFGSVTDARTETTGTAELLSELRAWLDDNWDPDLTVAEWWERLGLAGWSAPGLPDQRLRQGHGPLRRRPGAAGDRHLRRARGRRPGWACCWPPRPSPPTAPRSRSTSTSATS